MSQQTASASRMRFNQFGEMVHTDGDISMTPQQWAERWGKGQTRFHMPVVHPMLKKYYETAIRGKKAPVRCFLPLCGKSLDLKWLADQGHTVIGNEFAEQGCRQFFEEHNIPYDISPIGSIPGKVLKSKDKAIDVTLYSCDFFQLSTNVIGGAVDIVWDRGSLAAINFDERERYSKVITSLLSQQSTYLLDVFRVDNEVFAGPPNDLPEKEIRELFGATCNVEHLEKRNAMTEWQRQWGLKTFDEHVYLLKLK